MLSKEKTVLYKEKTVLYIYIYNHLELMESRNHLMAKLSAVCQE